MKMLTLLLIFGFFTLTVAAESPSESAPILFRSVVRLPDAEIFSVSTPDESKSAWVSIGDRFGQYTIAEFVAAENALIIHKDDQEWRLSLAGVSGNDVADEPLVISVSALGFVEEPGPIQISSKNPTALDVWKASGGGSPGIGSRLILTRTREDGDIEVQQIKVRLDSPGPIVDAELKAVLLQDGDVLFFPGNE